MAEGALSGFVSRFARADQPVGCRPPDPLQVFEKHGRVKESAA